MASKVVAKGTLKRKNDGKDDHPNKKGTGPIVDNKQLKQPLLPKPGHGVGDRLMTGEGLVIHGTFCRLHTHKYHAVEMVYSIIKEMDLNPCADQTMEDLGHLAFLTCLGYVT